MLKISISGTRGTVPDSLTPQVCLDFAKAFGTYLKGGTVVVGTDTRSSSEFIKGIAIQGLLSCGCNIIDLGIATTPTVGIMVRELEANGGLIITASHNPEPWNGLKFVRNDGIFLNSTQGQQLLDIYYSKAFVEQPGSRAKTNTKAAEIHIKKILKQINPGLIKRRKFKVVIDSVNGAGSVIAPELLRRLGCEVIELYTAPKAPFPRGAEPTPDNIKELARLVKEHHADAGFAQDPDADRLAIVTNTGEAISEEYTLALCSKFILKNANAPKKLVVCNLSTTAAIDDIAREFNAIVVRTKIGEVYVAEAIKKENAIIGGEGNGGIIYPKIGFNRDSQIGIALILMYMAKEKKPLSELVAQIPKYYLVKNKIECESTDEASNFIEKIKRKFQNDTLDLTEGVKVIRRDGWLHLRPSNTEAVIRVFAEARSKEIAEKFIAEALNS